MPLNPKRPKSLPGETIKHKTGCGTLYITINTNAEGKPAEVFMRLGKAGGCPHAFLEAIGRLIVRCWKYGVPSSEIIHDIQGIGCYKTQVFGEDRCSSCVDALARVFSEVLTGTPMSRPVVSAEDVKNIPRKEMSLPLCPNCLSSDIDMGDGNECPVCKTCGVKICDGIFAVG